jgi:hypothetical protein
VQPGIDKAASYARGAYDLAVAAQAEMGKLLDEQAVEFNKSINAALDAALSNAPAGSAPAVEAIRAAIGNADAARGSLAKAARELAAATEANFSAATAQAGGVRKKAA